MLRFGDSQQHRRKHSVASSTDRPRARRIVDARAPVFQLRWWRRQSKELSAITDDIENGLMQLMVTVSHNNYSPEYLACVRRGPFAVPTDVERIEYFCRAHQEDGTPRCLRALPARARLILPAENLTHQAQFPDERFHDPFGEDPWLLGQNRSPTARQDRLLRTHN